MFSVQPSRLCVDRFPFNSQWVHFFLQTRATFVLFAILIFVPSLLSWRSNDRLGGDKVSIDDCAPKPTCELCIKEHLCGWCSTPVIGGNGAQCAGFANGSTPFICQGTYQTVTCILPTTGTASTGPTTGTTTTGTTTSSTTTGPLPGPPVKGFWRGLEVNTGYVGGEWNFTFTDTKVVVNGPDKTRFAGDVFSSSNQLDIVIVEGDSAGKTLYGIFEIGQGPATHFFTYAVSPVGTTTRPVSWAIAMKDSTYAVWTLEQPKDF